MKKLFKTIETIAEKKYGGHYTILKFTNHYKGGFGTITEREQIILLKSHKTLKELLYSMIESEAINNKKMVY